MTEKERMDAGMLYICEDDNIMKVQLKHLEKLYDFNETRPSQLQLRDAPSFVKRAISTMRMFISETMSGSEQAR